MTFFFLQTTILTLIGPLFTILRRRQTLLQRVPLSVFTFSRKHTQPDVPKGSPLWIFFGTVRLFFENFLMYTTGRAQRVPPLDFFRHCATFFRKFFNVPKGSPLWVFWYFATECLLINPEGSPLLHFSALCDFFWKKNFFQKFQFFSKKSVLRFLSLRYGADFRRSRLVSSSDYYPHTDRSTFYNSAQSTWGQVRPRQTLLQRVPPFIFYFFKETYKTGRAQRVPPLDFFRNCATFFRKFFNVPKGFPLWVFWYFATECLLINPEGSPLLHFSALCDFFWKKNFFQKYQFFSKKNVLRSLSLRYGADFRRSRLVSSDYNPHTDRSTF